MASSDSSMPGNGRKIGIAAGLFVLAIATFVWLNAGAGPTGQAARAQAKSFYTVDDGKTWVADSVDLVPPFDRGGKPAVSAMVFSDDDGKTPFAGYLQRYDAATKKQFDANPKLPRIGIVGLEVKKPLADTKWIPRNSRAGIELTQVTSPRGSKNVEPVTP